MPEISVIGPEADGIISALSRFFPVCSDADPVDLLILLPEAAPPFPKCRILLIPDELLTIPESEIAVSYGMSSKCTVTLSSVGKSAVLSIQREMPVFRGSTVEPQEIPVINSMSLSKYGLMAASAALLILGFAPDLLS